MSNDFNNWSRIDLVSINIPVKRLGLKIRTPLDPACFWIEILAHWLASESDSQKFLPDFSQVPSSLLTIVEYKMDNISKTKNHTRKAGPCLK